MVYHTACEFTIIFACVPTRAQWELALRKHAKCFSLATYLNLGLANSIINMIVDILLAVLPIPVILGMQLSKRTKAALTFVMFLGFIAVGAAGVKLKAQIRFLQDTDRMYHDRFPIWATIELYFAILAASLPTLKPLLVRFLGVAKSSISGDSVGARRRTQMLDDSYSRQLAKNKGCYSSECSTTAATPASTAGSKEVGSYFSFFRKQSIWDSTKSESDYEEGQSMALEKISTVSSGSSNVKSTDEESRKQPGYIVRTRKVSTVSTIFDPSVQTPEQDTIRQITPLPMVARSGHRRSQSAIVSKRWSGSEGWKAMHSRNASTKEGWALRRAQESEEDLPGRSDSLEELVERRHRASGLGAGAGAGMTS